jgi:hypothetical protein
MIPGELMPTSPADRLFQRRPDRAAEAETEESDVPSHTIEGGETRVARAQPELGTEAPTRVSKDIAHALAAREASLDRARRRGPELPPPRPPPAAPAPSTGATPSRVSTDRKGPLAQFAPRMPWWPWRVVLVGAISALVLLAVVALLR